MRRILALLLSLGLFGILHAQANPSSPVAVQLVDPSTGTPYNAGGTGVASPVVYSPNYASPVAAILIDPSTGLEYKASGSSTTCVLGQLLYFAANGAVTACLNLGTNLTLSGNTLNASSTAATAFSALTGSTNTSAAMVVGTGASLAVTGSGTIAATSAPLSGISGLGAGIATWLATPSSANLAAALTDETGTGSAVFGTSPTLTTPNLGTPSAINLSNATALPLSALANLGTTTTVLHGNAAGNPSFAAVNLATDVTGTLPSGNGGTGNAFFAVSGPASATKTYTFPNASATVLTTNAAVTVAQGGTGVATLTTHGVLLGEGTSNVSSVAAMAADTLLQGQGATSDPTAVALTSCSSASSALTYNTTTHAFGCNTISGSGTVNSGTSGQLAYYASSGTAVSPLTTPLPLIGYATASLPTCNTAAKGEIAYTTDSTAALVFCTGSTWAGTGGTQFTYTATGCTPSAAAGSATAGTITLASGPCTSIVITPNGAQGMTAANGYHCNVGDRTTQNAGTWIPSWGESASTTTTVTIPIPAAAGATDVISFSCTPY